MWQNVHSFILALSETNYFFPLFHLIQVLIKKCLKAVPGHKLHLPGLHEIRPDLSFHAVVVIVFSPTDSFMITFGL